MIYNPPDNGRPFIIDPTDLTEAEAALLASTERVERLRADIRSAREERDHHLARVREERRITNRRPGSAGRPDWFYALWAQRYVRALPNGAPVHALVEEERQQGRHYTKAAVNAFLRKARVRGLLTAASPGKAGGELTAKGRRVLAAAGLLEDGG